MFSLCSVWLCSWLREEEASPAFAEIWLNTAGAQERIWEEGWNLGSCLFSSLDTENRGLWQQHCILLWVTDLLWTGSKWDPLLYWILVLQANITEGKLCKQTCRWFWTKLLLQNNFSHCGAAESAKPFTEDNKPSKREWMQKILLSDTIMQSCQLMEWHEGGVQLYSQTTCQSFSLSWSGRDVLCCGSKVTKRQFHSKLNLYRSPHEIWCGKQRRSLFVDRLWRSSDQMKVFYILSMDGVMLANWELFVFIMGITLLLSMYEYFYVDKDWIGWFWPV